MTHYRAIDWQHTRRRVAAAISDPQVTARIERTFFDKWGSPPLDPTLIQDKIFFLALSFAAALYV